MDEEETVKIRWNLSIGLVGGRSDEYDTGYTPAEWAEMDEDEQAAIVREEVFQYIEWDWEEV